MNNSRTVAVTGAAGYIGSHVVRELLAAGHTVHGTVRDPNDEKKTAHLRALPGAERLSLFAADLRDPDAFDEAFAGCQWVCHVASAVLLTAKDPQREIVDPAVSGTRHALAAAERAGVERLAMTSSIAAAAPSEGKGGTTLDESCWNDQATLKHDPYSLSKVRAEREAWSFMGTSRPFSLVTILPGFVFGPVMARVHLRSSPSLLRQVYRGKMPMLPRLSFAMVDVRDVAIAHVRALETPAAEGRYLAVAGNMWMEDWSRVLRDNFPECDAPTRRAPRTLLYALSLVSSNLSLHFLRHNLGRERFFDSSKARRDLGLTFRPLEESIVDTARSF